MFGIGCLGHHSGDKSGCFFGVYMLQKKTEVRQVASLIWMPTEGER